MCGPNIINGMKLMSMRPTRDEVGPPEAKAGGMMTSALERLKTERERGCPTCGGILWSENDELQDALLALWEACEEANTHALRDPFGCDGEPGHCSAALAALNAKAEQVLGED